MLEFRRGRPPPEAACTWPRRTAKDRQAAPGSPKRGGTARCPTSSPLGIREDRNFLACRGTARHPRGISWILIFKFEFQFSISKNSGGRPRSVQDFLKSSKKIQKILKLLPSGSRAAPPEAVWTWPQRAAKSRKEPQTARSDPRRQLRESQLLVSIFNFKCQFLKTQRAVLELSWHSGNFGEKSKNLKVSAWTSSSASSASSRTSSSGESGESGESGVCGRPRAYIRRRRSRRRDPLGSVA